MIDWLQSILDWYMQNVNYWSVLVCMTIESSIIPFPAELHRADSQSGKAGGHHPQP